MSNAERTRSRPLFRCEAEAIVEARGCCEKTGAQALRKNPDPRDVQCGLVARSFR